MALGPDPAGVSVAELVATLSYAADLGLGQPMAHCMRQTVIALRLADLAGAGDEDRRATYYLGLMMNSWCHADAAEQASWFGDDISFKGDGYETLGMNTAQTVAFLVRRVGSHGSGAQRIRRLAEFPLTGHALVSEFLRTHCAGRRVRRTDRLGCPGRGGRASGLRAVGRQGRARTAPGGGDLATGQAGPARRPRRGLQPEARG